MDTTSHILMGLGLGALAQINPVIANDDVLTQAVVLGTIIGSNAPDFDFMYLLKGKGSYYRNHRAWSHSLLALPLWSAAVSGIIFSLFNVPSFSHLFFWTFLAVILHVFFDLFNVHGTQVLLPFSNKWIAFDSLPLFDPMISFVHILGFLPAAFL